VWTSNTELLTRSVVDNNCRLQLQGSHLVLTAGNPEMLVWYSRSREEAASGDFVSRLEPDGILVVYRLEPLSFETPWLSRMYQATAEKQHIPRLLVPVRRMLAVLWSLLVGGPIWHLPDGRAVRGVCQSATGSAVGCFRLGRRLIQFYRDGQHLIQHIGNLLDNVF
jgi:hypothetical protein